MGFDAFSNHLGEWVGSNGFRLMPRDELATRPAAAALSLAAGSHIATVVYRWEHPQDGPQEGLVVVGLGEAPGSLVAMWGDSWHQNPQPMSMTGRLEGAEMHLEGEYAGGWGWRLSVVADGDHVRLGMANVIPAGAADDSASAGPYDVMVMDLTRASGPVPSAADTRYERGT